MQFFKYSQVFFFLAAALVILPACSSAVVFTTSTNVGIELNTMAGGMQTAKLGYQRVEGVSMPHANNGGQMRSKAYSVVSMFDMKTGGLNLKELGAVKIKQVFATGKAATGKNGEGAVKAVASGFAAIHGKHLSELMDEKTLSSAKELIAFLEKHRDEESVHEAMAKALGIPKKTSYGDLSIKIRRIADDPAKAHLLSKALKAGQEALKSNPGSKPDTRPGATSKPQATSKKSTFN